MNSDTTQLIWIGAALVLVSLGILVPTGLAWLNDRNRRWLAALRRQAARAQAEVQRVETAVSPFATAISPIIRQRVDRLHDNLAHNTDIVRQVAGTSPTLPKLPATAWPGYHILRRPGTAVAIIRDWWLLRRAHQHLQAAHHTTQHSLDLLTELNHLPDELRRQYQTLTERLAAVADAAAAEQAAGMQNLAPLLAAQQALAAQAEALTTAIASVEATAVSADPVALQLDNLAARLTTTEQDVTARQTERETYTQARAEIAAKSTGGSTETSHAFATQIAAESVAAVQTADREARWGHWPQAHLWLHTAEKWEQLGNAVTRPLTAVAQLAPLAATSRQPDDIAGLHTQLDDILGQLQQRLSPAQRPDNWWEAVAAPYLPELSALAARADELRQAYYQDQRGQEQAANQAKRSLEQAWQGLQRYISLAPGDGLRTSYTDILNRYQHIAGNPASYHRLAQQANTLAADLQDTKAYLAVRLQALDKLRRQMPDYVAEAEELAGSWRCLQDELAVVKETAVFLQQFPTQQKSLQWLAELHNLLDETKRQWLLADEALHRLRRDGERLQNLYGRVIQIWETLSSAPEENQRQEMVRRVVAAYLDSALGATAQEDAINALQQAENYLAKLV